MSDDELSQAQAFYDEARVGDQVDYYQKRIDEYRRSAGQISLITELLLLSAAVAGIAGAFWGSLDFGWIASLTAAGLAATAAGLASWADTVGFVENAELYSAARDGVMRTRLTRPKPSAITAAAVDDYVDRVEDILLGEVGEWGDTWQSGGKPPL